MIATPVVSVDLVIFQLGQEGLEVLLHRREHDPFSGHFALPGAAMRSEETLVQTAHRICREKIGVIDVHLEQLATFDGLYRDPRGRTISIAHLGLTRVAEMLRTDTLWRRISEIESGGLPFDHYEILTAAINRIRGKVRYSNVAAHLLPEHFRIEVLQDAYEAILGIELNRTNFRNKLLKLGIIEKVGELSEAVSHKGGRPPHLYRFSSRDLELSQHDFV